MDALRIGYVDGPRRAEAAVGPARHPGAVPATPVIATHLGAGAWGVAWMVEDGPDEEA